MAHILLYCYLSLFTNWHTPQQSEVNCILVVNGQIVPNVSAPKLILISQKDTTKIDVNYHPGSLRVENSFLDLASKGGVNEVIWSFAVFDTRKKDVKSTAYEIKLNTLWLSEEYLIIKVYDAKNRGCRRKLTHQKHTLDIDSPNYTVRSARK